MALSRWGLDGYLAGVTGDDDFGQKILAFLAGEGVDVRGVQIRRGGQSQFAFIISETSNARRTIFWQRPTGRPLGPDEIDRDILLQSSLLYTDGLFAEASLYACRKAKDAGIPVMVDAGTLREGMFEMAGMSDCFIASQTFSDAFAETPAETCRKLAGMGVKLAGVTLGEKGYVALTEGRFLQKAAYPASACDTTGCGDVFHAGVAYGLVRGWSAEKALDLGAWAAAQASTQMGGRKGIPEKRALEEKYGG